METKVYRMGSVDGNAGTAFAIGEDLVMTVGHVFDAAFKYAHEVDGEKRIGIVRSDHIENSGGHQDSNQIELVASPLVRVNVGNDQVVVLRSVSKLEGGFFSFSNNPTLVGDQIEAVGFPAHSESSWARPSLGLL